MTEGVFEINSKKPVKDDLTETNPMSLDDLLAYIDNVIASSR
jgi:hypothetical protein